MRRPPVTCVSVSVLSPTILIPAFLNGLLIGAVYALVALGLTLVYGVLHIINFAHGALLTAAMFAAYFAYTFGIDPYVAAFLLAPAFFAFGYALQRFIIGNWPRHRDGCRSAKSVANNQVHTSHQ